MRSKYTSLKDLHVVAFCGYAGSGKGAASTLLIDGCGGTYLSRIFSFAGPIRDICSRVYHVPIHIFKDPILKNQPHPNLNGKTPRQVMQLIGTEGFRNLIDVDTWTKCLERDVLLWVNSIDSVYPPLIVIDDLRFISEFEFLTERNATCLYIDRPEVTQQFAHQSEQEISVIGPKCIASIRNDGSLKHLKQQVLESIFPHYPLPIVRR